MKRRFPAWRTLTGERRRRAIVRSIANVYQRRGKLTPAALCEDCGRAPATEKHHDDYDKPLAVKWLCHPCHLKRNNAERAARAAAEDARLCGEWERRLAAT